MTDFGPSDVLFISLPGYSHVAWYRCILPALSMRCDWISGIMHEGSILVTSSSNNLFNRTPVFDYYKIIVIQQPASSEWYHWIKQRKAAGVVVLYEIDDDMHAVADMDSHPNRQKINDNLHWYEICMRTSNGIITSTSHLAMMLKTSRMNKKVYVCEAGIDSARYDVKRPLRRRLNIGFAGGFGHETSLWDWFGAVKAAVDKYDVQFVSVGVNYADYIEGSLAIPAVPVEAYPGVLANFDIVLAPAGDSLFFKSKSQLRWIEASAAGIPVIGDPSLYVGIDHGRTGMLAQTPDEVFDAITYLRDPSKRKIIGTQAKNAVAKYDIDKMRDNWVDAFESAVD